MHNYHIIKQQSQLIQDICDDFAIEILHKTVFPEQSGTIRIKYNYKNNIIMLAKYTPNIGWQYRISEINKNITNAIDPSNFIISMVEAVKQLSRLLKCQASIQT